MKNAVHVFRDVDDPEAIDPFYIPATQSILERRPRILKHGNMFGLFDHYGDINGAPPNPEGLYYEDTRFLSQLLLGLNGVRPLLLSSNVQSNNVLLSVDLTNPDFKDGDQVTLPRDTIHITRSKFLWKAECHERIGIHNYDAQPHAVSLSFRYKSDFADLFEVRGQTRPRRGEQRVEVKDGCVSFIYTGLDDIVRKTVLRFDPVPDILDRHAATFRLELPPQKRLSIFFSVSCVEDAETRSQRQKFFVALRDARSELKQIASRMAKVESSNQIFNEMMTRSSRDMSMLTTQTPQGGFSYAGIPWFSTPFGRDGIITAMQMLWADPQMAVGVLKFLAFHQAKEIVPDADAEPGKILHEMRFGEMSRLKEVPFGFYYGAADSTPLFIMLAGMYYDRTGDITTIAHLWPNLEAALRWMDQYGDRDGDGFIEYGRRDNAGLINQGWKDSYDSVFHADGSLARGPIALCEVQGYAYAARRHAAKLASALGFTAAAAALDQQAQELKEKFSAAFWCEDIGTFALALDGDKKPCRVRTSNAGQLLFSGIVSQEQAEKIADQLFSIGFFSGWGIRTVAVGESRYNPMAYHNGSIWPHDNALIAMGLARYGFRRRCRRLLTGIFDAASYMDLQRLPELYCGFSRRPDRPPTLYPVACIPQAWASAAPFSLLQSCLGIDFNPALEEVRFHHPQLPSFLDHIILRDVKTGATCMDIMLQRYGDEVAVNVLKRSGNGGASVTL